jgi:hypothetical protein
MGRPKKNKVTQFIDDVFTPKKEMENTVELETEFGNIGVETTGKSNVSHILNTILDESSNAKYSILDYKDINLLVTMVIKSINNGHRCLGGICIHDIRNQLTNEYEPHFYQAMEKVDK